MVGCGTRDVIRRGDHIVAGRGERVADELGNDQLRIVGEMLAPPREQHPPDVLAGKIRRTWVSYQLQVILSSDGTGHRLPPGFDVRPCVRPQTNGRAPQIPGQPRLCPTDRKLRGSAM
jgi:hypothetical protein